jgi:hypothetical protein
MFLGKSHSGHSSNIFVQCNQVLRPPHTAENKLNGKVDGSLKVAQSKKHLPHTLIFQRFANLVSPFDEFILGKEKGGEEKTCLKLLQYRGPFLEATIPAFREARHSTPRCSRCTVLLPMSGRNPKS